MCIIEQKGSIGKFFLTNCFLWFFFVACGGGTREVQPFFLCFGKAVADVPLPFSAFLNDDVFFFSLLYDSIYCTLVVDSTAKPFGVADQTAFRNCINFAYCISNNGSTIIICNCFISCEFVTIDSCDGSVSKSVLNFTFSVSDSTTSNSLVIFKDSLFLSTILNISGI